MKKITLLFILTLLFSWQGISQTLNEPAGWPNTDWTVTGVYNTDPLAFEADPTLTANFAFDDDDAGNGSDDDIAAESPVIDLTAAANNGETWLNVTADYTYRKLDDTLTLEYWDADGAAWIFWELFVQNDGTINNEFCSGVRTTFTSMPLDIAAFTATQLSGFQYRISFLDDGGAGGAAYEWGFCFDAPTITSQMPPACSNPSEVTVSNILDVSVDVSWTEGLGAASYDWEIVPLGNAQGDGVIDSGNIMATSATLMGLTADTSYSFYIKSNCETAYFGPTDFTTLAGPPPANDLCAGAFWRHYYR